VTPERGALRRLGLPILGAFGFLVLWEGLTRGFGVPAYLVPPPRAVFDEIAEFPGWYAEQALATTLIALGGFAAAAVLGLLFAIAITESRTLERLLFPLFVALNSVPKVAVAPLLVIWFGTGAEPKLAIAFLIAVFAVVVDAALGLRSAPSDVLDLARALRGSRLRILWRVKLPAALPSIFAGFKVAMSLALVGAIVGEFVSSQRGLGHVILAAQGSFDTPRVFAALAILAVLGVALIAAVEAAERALMPWRRGVPRRRLRRPAA
jgi:NitT/TauT family transport system permease protein